MFGTERADRIQLACHRTPLLAVLRTDGRKNKWRRKPVRRLCQQSGQERTTVGTGMAQMGGKEKWLDAKHIWKVELTRFPKGPDGVCGH